VECTNKFCVNGSWSCLHWTCRSKRSKSIWPLCQKCKSV